jgi:hypothetical protein
MEIGFRYGGHAQVVNAQVRISALVILLSILASWGRNLVASSSAVERLGNVIEVVFDKIIGFPELCPPCYSSGPNAFPSWSLPTSAQVGVFVAVLIVLRPFWW